MKTSLPEPRFPDTFRVVLIIKGFLAALQCRAPGGRCVLALAVVMTNSTLNIAAQEHDPLTPYRGSRLLVEFPALDDIGRQIDPPHGWKYFQVTAESYDLLLMHLDPDRSPEAFLYFDEFGNLAHRVQARDRFSRLERGYEDADKQIVSWRKRLRRDTHALADARKLGKEAKELELLTGIRDSNLDGYPEVISARIRILELEGIREADLWGVLALEGLVRRRALASALSDLHDRSQGLTVAAVIELEFDRVDAGRVTHEKRSGSTGE